MTDGFWQDFEEELDQTGFFDDLDRVLEWLNRLYSQDYLPIMDYNNILQVFRDFGFTPDMYVGYSGEQNRETYGKYLIGQALGNIANLNHPSQVLFVERWPKLYQHYQSMPT